MKTLLLIICVFIGGQAFAQHAMEQLDRGLVAVKTTSGVFVSWRIPGDEWQQTTYNVYRNGQKLNDLPLEVSNFADAQGNIGSNYTIAPVINDVEAAASDPVGVWANQYKEIGLDLPAGGTTPANEGYSYTVGDMSTGHLNNDASLDLVVKWEALARDNSHAGYTAPVLLDGYTLEGEKLWRIDLGINIRAGAHYTQFMVYDFDGDGIAEIACKTAPGTKDGLGNFISKGPAALANHAADYRNTGGYILSGPEYLTVFSGLTGEELSTVAYQPPRGNVGDWGDGYGNRVDRFLAAVAYLDGEKPSLVMTRGYYTRSVLAAYDFDGNQLTLRWIFDSNTPGNGAYAGQGNHNLSVADADGDGRDEIIFGSCTIDDDGTGLYSTRLGHGDAMHVSDFDPYRKGLEVFRCLESGEGGSVLHGASDGSIMIRHISNSDCGRCMAANVTNAVRGAQVWGCSPVYSATSKQDLNYLGLATSVNFRIYWDGDLLSELLNHTTVTKPTTGQAVFVAPGGHSNNGTKGTPALQADLLGDWREELIYRTDDPSKIRIYTTVDASEHRIYSLMHDRQYRLAIAWQNVGYNQPPHTSFFIGETEGITVPPPPIMTNGRLVYAGAGTWDKTALNWNKDGAALAYEDGSHVHFSGQELAQETVSLSETLAPGALSVVTYGQLDLQAESASLSGSMRLSKQGSGTFSLNGTHDYSGPTEVWDGKMIFSGQLTSSPVWVNMHGQLTADGTLDGGLTLRHGAQLMVGGENSVGQLAIQNNLTLEEKAELVFDLFGTETVTHDALTVDGDMTLTNGAVITIHLDAEAQPAAGSYLLISCPGTAQFDLSQIELAGIDALPASLVAENGNISLVIREARSPADISWVGQISNEWDLAMTENFLVNGTATYFVTGDRVLVNDDAQSQTLNLTEALMPASLDFNHSKDFVISGSGTIAGNTPLTKNGSGVLSVQNVNSFTGKILVEEGTLEVHSLPNAIDGNGAIGGVSTNGQLLEINGGRLSIAQPSTSERAMTIGANGATVNTDAAAKWNALISGTGHLIKTGTHELAFGAANTFSELVLKEGTVQLTSEQALPGKKVVFEGGILRDYDSGGSYSYSGYPLVVEEGQTGTLYADGRCTYANTLTGSGTLRVSIPWIRTDFEGNWSNFHGTIQLLTGNSFRNFSTHGYANAVLDLHHEGVFDDMRTQTVRIGSLTGSGRLWGASLWVLGSRNGDFTFSGTITGGNIQKTGSGTMTIASKLESTGTLTISEGGVLVGGSSNGPGTSRVIVKNGAFLSGNGLIQGTVTIESGGSLHTGYYPTDNPTAGSSIRLSNVQMQSGARLQVRVSAETQTADRMFISGTLAANGTLVMENVSTSPYEAGMSFKVASATGVSGEFTAIEPETPGEGLKWDLSSFASEGTVKVQAATSLIEESASNTALHIYPNPGKGHFILTLPRMDAENHVQVENLMGQRVMTALYTGVAQVPLNLSALEKGLYIVRVMAGGKLYQTKVILE